MAGNTEHMPPLPNPEDGKDQMPFFEIKIDRLLGDRCIDGRQFDEQAANPQVWETDGSGPQGIGGSLYSILVSAIQKNVPFDKPFLTGGIRTLREQGYTPGVHTGDHQIEHPQNRGQVPTSDCGAGDNIKKIVGTVKDREQVIRERLQPVFADPENFGLGGPEALESALTEISSYNPTEMITIEKREITDAAREAGAVVTHVENDHQEGVAHVNLKPDVTFDTNKAVRLGKSGFNLDLPYVIKESEALGVENSAALHLVLYMATEMVLVEEKGKPPVPVHIHR